MLIALKLRWSFSLWILISHLLNQHGCCGHYFCIKITTLKTVREWAEFGSQSAPNCANVMQHQKASWKWQPLTLVLFYNIFEWIHFKYQSGMSISLEPKKLKIKEFTFIIIITIVIIIINLRKMFNYWTSKSCITMVFNEWITCFSSDDGWQTRIVELPSNSGLVDGTKHRSRTND